MASDRHSETPIRRDVGKLGSHPVGIGNKSVQMLRGEWGHDREKLP
ncbi:hypothetical protein MMARE11_06250 [Mycobacterium marinum E11]|nr:hypothetical protein MMARE11_06250 [Mycobacterium marinum E11]